MVPTKNTVAHGALFTRLRNRCCNVLPWCWPVLRQVRFAMRIVVLVRLCSVQARTAIVADYQSGVAGSLKSAGKKSILVVIELFASATDCRRRGKWGKSTAWGGPYMQRSFPLGKVRVKMSPPDRFAQALQQRGKRMTRQRQLIVQQVFSHHDHFDADELLEHLRPLLAQRKLSRPTVYRTLAELVEAGLLRKMSLGGRSIYEHEYGYPRHDHLYCQQCNRLVEFHSLELDRVCAEVAAEHQFELSGHRMLVVGICASCRQAK